MSSPAGMRLPAAAFLPLPPKQRRFGEKYPVEWVWRARDGHLLAILRGHTERVVSVEFAANAPLMITASWDGTVRLWSTAAFERPAHKVSEEVYRAWGFVPQRAELR